MFNTLLSVEFHNSRVYYSLYYVKYRVWKTQNIVHRPQSRAQTRVVSNALSERAQGFPTGF